MIEVMPGFFLPDLAAIVRTAFESDRPPMGKADAEAIGRILLRQLDQSRGASGGLRLSSAGACIRRLGYDFHHWEPNGHAVDASSRVTFAIGDATEQLLTAALASELARVGGFIESYGENQRTVFMDVWLSQNRTARIAGHPDGVVGVIGKKDDVSRRVTALIEVKSMSDYALMQFKKNGGLDKEDSYYGQVQAYMAAMGLAWAYVLVFGKTVTVKDYDDDMDGSWRRAESILGAWVPFDPDAASDITGRFRRVLESTSVEELPRPYKPDGKGRLKFPCDWCPYWGHCWPGALEVPLAMRIPIVMKKIHLKIGGGE